MQYTVKIDIKLSNKNVYQYLQRRITLSISILTPVTHHFETLAVPPDGPPGHLLVVDLGHGLHGKHSLYSASLFLHSICIYI